MLTGGKPDANKFRMPRVKKGTLVPKEQLQNLHPS